MAHRIDGDGTVVDGNGAGKDGFGDTGPNPTTVTDDWLNDVQENYVQYIESRGITPVKLDFTQLTDAVHTHFPASSTDNRVATFHSTTGKVIQDNSPVTISDAGAIAGATSVTLSGEVTYATPKTRVHFFPATAGKINFTTAAVAADSSYEINGRAAIRAPSVIVHWDMNELLPDGATVTRVRALVSPGTSQATPANRSSLSGTKAVHNFATPGTGSSSDVFTTVPDSGTAAYQVIDSGTFSETVDKTGLKAFVVYVIPDSGASGSNVCRVNGVEVTWTDAGPRS